jgi:LacI family transcriptional regulator
VLIGDLVTITHAAANVRPSEDMTCAVVAGDCTARIKRWTARSEFGARRLADPPAHSADLRGGVDSVVLYPLSEEETPPVSAVTVRDVARAAGVSVATVSRVVHGARYVRPELRAAVTEAIRDLDYRPSELARQFRDQRSRLVGCVVPDIAEPFYAAILRGVVRVLRPQGFVVSIHDTDERVSAEADAIVALLDARAAGVIVASSGPWPAPLLDRFRSSPLPIVAIDNGLEGIACDAVYDDNEPGCATLTAHLAGHGHRRIAFVGGIATETSGVERLAGYRRGLAEAGLPADDGLVAMGEWRRESVRLFALRLMRQPEPPTAFVAANDDSALGVMKALRSLRLRIPEDVALVAFDDYDVAELLDPPLTGLRRDVGSMGELAAGLLVEQLYPAGGPGDVQQESPGGGGVTVGDARVGGPREVRIHHDLVARRSCGCEEETRMQR